ncbi:hypothetical protein RH915_01885 [Serpentinicella sp. ANB-PHB4]|uniref:hypothetical protein n=1 Tax=Serpentinicella sp. ANB-PHB4 TaxID=3074076 RepID=UPI0028569E3B|nr:hypothetical protein [Serpentinicella sp. ANB-PHB4]MDR5658232.1 hypothetical protein [Serpentinicella sp. ANB-PHB4]
MQKSVDVLGFELNDALFILNELNMQYTVNETYGKDAKKMDGIKRVVGQRNISLNEVEIIISYFKAPFLGL